MICDFLAGFLIWSIVWQGKIGTFNVEAIVVQVEVTKKQVTDFH